MAEAEGGNVYGVALALCMEGGWAKNLAGTRPGDLNLALDALKKDILDNVTNADLSKEIEIRRQKSSIIRIK